MGAWRGRSHGSGCGVTLDYDELDHLRLHHPAWVLLRANNAALVLGFLGRVFVDANAGDLPTSYLASELDDELYALRERLGVEAFPRPASAYLDDWAAPEHGWLRKYYPSGSDEAHYGLSPAVEKALLWVRDLPSRDFVGTESRLNTIFELLRQMVFGAEADPERRLAELRRRRDEIDEEIARTEQGEIELLDDVGQRDRYQQFAAMARELLSDFREVEENFRRLDRQMRERIAEWTGSKGQLLDDVLGSRHSIGESDQGRSFQAFYDFLLSTRQQHELSDLLQRLEQIESVPDVDPQLTRVHFDWIDAAERTQGTVRVLSEQLRRFLDDQVWLENRRVVELLQSVEAKAFRLRGFPHPDLVMELADTKPMVCLPTERPLYRQRRDGQLESGPVEEGDDDFDSTALVDQIHVDREDLLQRVLSSLARGDQVGLDRVLADRPLQQGVAELLGYLSLQQPGLDVVFDDDGRMQVAWASDDVDRIADLPLVTFARHEEGSQ